MLGACALAVGCSAGQAPHGAPPGSSDASAIHDAALDAPVTDAAVTDAAVTWAPRDLIAARLSRFLWNQPLPDPATVTAVEAAGSADDVAAIAQQMLADPRARAGIAAFFTWWLRLDDLATQPKDDPGGVFTTEVRAALQQEAPAFGTSVILDGDGRYQTLMTAPYTFMNEVLARHYGVTGVTGPELRQVPFGTADRIGLLGEASVLARFAGNTVVSWPPRRFWLVRQTLLCMTGLDSAVPINTTLFVITASPTLREQIETVTAPSNCRPCHMAVNPIGDAFIKFDSLGQLASDSFAGPYDDASGLLPANAGGFFSQDFAFTDQPDFMRQMAARAEARDCFAWVALNFAVERPRTADVSGFSPASRPSLDGLVGAFESTGDIPALLVALTRTPAFLQASGAVEATP